MKLFTLIIYILTMTVTIHFIFVFYYGQLPKLSRPRQYITGRLFTLKQAGIGNCFFEILALLGVANSLNRIAFINSLDENLTGMFDKRIKYNFPKLFDQFVFKDVDEKTMSMRDFHGTQCCKKRNPRILQNYTDEYLFIKGAYFQSFLYFDSMRDDVREWLTPAQKWMTLADTFLKNDQLDKFKICVHVRRGDFAPGKMHAPTNVSFTIPAVKFLLSEYDDKQSMLVFLGNDEDFEKSISQNFKDIETLILPKSDPEKDLAFSRQHCDVVLITAPSSTFGWWLGYLSKTGKLVYYEDILETADKVSQQMIQQDFYPSYWTKLVTDKKTGNVHKF